MKLLDDLQEIRQGALDMMEMLNSKIESIDPSKTDRADLADIAWQLRELADALDRARVNCKKAREWIGATIAKGGDLLPIEGRYCNAFPEQAEVYSLPRVGSDGYRALCARLGVTDSDAIGLAVIDFRFPRFTEWLERLADAGKELPDGLGKRTVFRTILRTKNAPADAAIE